MDIHLTNNLNAHGVQQDFEFLPDDFKGLLLIGRNVWNLSEGTVMIKEGLCEFDKRLNVRDPLLFESFRNLFPEEIKKCGLLPQTFFKAFDLLEDFLSGWKVSLRFWLF